MFGIRAWLSFKNILKCSCQAGAEQRFCNKFIHTCFFSGCYPFPVDSYFFQKCHRILAAILIIIYHKYRQIDQLIPDTALLKQSG